MKLPTLPKIYNPWFVAFVATVGGMLFGFDISSMSAIIGMLASSGFASTQLSNMGPRHGSISRLLQRSCWSSTGSYWVCTRRWQRSWLDRRRSFLRQIWPARGHLHGLLLVVGRYRYANCRHRVRNSCHWSCPERCMRWHNKFTSPSLSGRACAQGETGCVDHHSTTGYRVGYPHHGKHCPQSPCLAAPIDALSSTSSAMVVASSTAPHPSEPLGRYSSFLASSS